MHNNNTWVLDYWLLIKKLSWNTLDQKEGELPISGERKSLVKTICESNCVTNNLKLKRYNTKTSDTSMLQYF